jgi:hypothetical protein
MTEAEAMSRTQNEAHAREYFDQARVRLTRLAERLVEDAGAAVEEAAVVFDKMLPDMAYVDKPQHPLAPALFVTSVNLAMYLALRERGVGVHEFGRALLNGLARAPLPVREHADASTDEQRRAAFIAAAEDSRRGAAAGEDVFEVVSGEGADFDYGINVLSCAVCHAYARHDAMELVPYMCATDDVMSDKEGTGLRRTGSIALGAHHCDFRYKRGGEPLPLAPQYPDKIRRAES